MNLLVSQSNVRMAGDLRYIVAQASILMFVAVHMSRTHLKTLQGVVASIREELWDSEADCQVLSEQNSIVACKKPALEDHMATLEVQTN